MLNTSIQNILTGVIIALAVLYVLYKIIKRIIRRNDRSIACGGCNGCPLKENCKPEDKDKCSLY